MKRSQAPQRFPGHPLVNEPVKLFRGAWDVCTSTACDPGKVEDAAPTTWADYIPVPHRFELKLISRPDVKRIPNRLWDGNLAL